MMACDIPGFLQLCRSHGISIVTAESCTGGLILAALTDIPGSSDIVWGGFVVYANASKVISLGVPPELIEEYGAVSDEVVRAMVLGAQKRSSCSLALAVSGIAGPEGGSPEKPVGTVWIAVSLAGKELVSQCCFFTGNRKKIRNLAVEQALKLCEKIINQ